MLKKVTSIILLMVCLCLLFGCNKGSTNPTQESTAASNQADGTTVPSATPLPTIRAQENINANLTNGGAGGLGIQGDLIYYTDNSELITMKKDGSEKNIINSDNGYIQYINVMGDRIYYSDNISTKLGIYTIKTNGTDKKKLNDSYITGMLVTDGKIYYCDSSNDVNVAGLYSMKIDGSDIMKLAEGQYRNLNISDDWIYYCGEIAENSEISNIWAIKIDDSDKKQISDESLYQGNLDNGRYRGVDSFIVQSDKIYYTTCMERESKNLTLYVMNKDGSGKDELLNEDFGYGYSIAGDRIIYDDNNIQGELCTMKTDGTDKKTLDFGQDEFPLNIEGYWVSDINIWNVY